MLFHCQKALEIRIKSLGGAHGPTRKNRIATVLEQQGKINEALKLHEEALEKMIQAVGQSHVSVAKTKKNVGTNYEVNTNDEAVRAWRGSTSKKPMPSPEVAWC